MTKFNTDDLGLNSLGDLLKEAERLVKESMAKLSPEDKAKVNKIVDSVDKEDLEAMQSKISELNAERNNLNEDKDA